MNKRHEIILNEKDSSHQCSLFIESASKADSGLFKFFSNYGRLISECSLVVNESPQTDYKLAVFILVPVVITVVLLAAIVVFVYTVNARRQANHQPAAPNLDPASPLELSPLVNQDQDARQVGITGTNNDDDPARTTPSTSQAV